MDNAPDNEQRRLNLPAVQPISLNDASSSSTVSSSTRFYVPAQTLHSGGSKGLNKRPSTAALAQSNDVLLPATRQATTVILDDAIANSSAFVHDARLAAANKSLDNRDRIGFVVNISGDPNSLTQSSLPEGVSNDLYLSNKDNNELSDESFDWGSFLQAYAAGKWDPRLTPNPPKSQYMSEMEATSPYPDSSSPSATSGGSRKRTPGTFSSSNLTSRLSLGSANGRSPVSGITTISSPTASTHSASVPGPHKSIKYRRQGDNQQSATSVLPHLPLPPPPSRPFSSRSMSDSPTMTYPAAEGTTKAESLHELHAAAATMRLAAEGVDVRPLALPSPEVELTDPFRGHTASLTLAPRPKSEKVGTENETDFTGPSKPPPVESGGQSSRKIRLNSFWNILNDVIGSPPTAANPGFRNHTTFEHPSALPTISASPPITPEDGVTNTETDSATNPDAYVTADLLPSGSPSQKSSRDYFTIPVSKRNRHPPAYPKTTRGSSQSTSQASTALPTTSSVDYASVFDSSSSSSQSILPPRPPLDRTVSEPISMKHSNYVDNFSIDASPDISAIARSYSESQKHPRARVKEEVEYLHRGYLRPPTPPSEWERQKALYKFNIVHTAKDANFDRIALLAKLVFNAKICLISLIDADEQWFKSEFGLGRESCPRDESICSHAILQDSCEPLVILDTHTDWRFSKNPFVISHPFARFYAGAPLRTAEGYNIGSLCIIDTEPRSEFGPRQRHTLKEFAAIVMRELELWRDKIQLRIRDRIQNSMEQFTRECLEIDTQAQKGDPRSLLSSTSMEKIYDRAVKLVKRTLDVEGAVLIDVSTFEEFDTHNLEASPSVLLYHSDPKQSPLTKPLTPAGFAQMSQFFRDFPDGKVSEAVLPACIRSLMPGNIHYALTVPIMNIDKRPFAMLCAYNTNAKTKPYLEGHELSYLRAIGVIILSAVLKRRMILADKAKSLFISNISHELRTPLHGILAAAELLSGTDLTPNQKSFLSTVQACGTSLVETVNHVLDFTKLSGSTKAGGSETVIRPAQVDMSQLIEEAAEGCWIGHRGRHSSEIGSVYSPQNNEDMAPKDVWLRSRVETVVDIEYRAQGWNVLCEKGGIRRCLMNLLGNSLKFTSEGYVHVSLRQLPLSHDAPENRIKLELGVFDSGKGISEDFIKNQLFQPFSQENPLQPGTGLGLAIVNSIIRSESIKGKIDVSSTENVGTDIKIIFEVEAIPADPENEGLWEKEGFENAPIVSLLGFGDSRGEILHKQIITQYLVNWWHFSLTYSETELGDLIILNEDIDLVRYRIDQQDCSRPLIFISSARGDPNVLSIADEYQRAGGFARVVFKPAGPTALQAALRLCIQVIRMGTIPLVPRPLSQGSLPGDRPVGRDLVIGPSGYVLNRRRSDGTDPSLLSLRPSMAPRSVTHQNLQRATESSSISTTAIDESDTESSTNVSSMVSVGSGGLLLRSSIGTLVSNKPIHVLVVEDNSILRELLVKWLRTKGYHVHEAADGQSGVEVFKTQIFDVVLLDMSMPVLDGVGAATAIRRAERERRLARSHLPSTAELMYSSKLIALTGMSSREDKRKAFEAGVDGYLVKPVSFKTLQSIFRQLGIT